MATIEPVSNSDKLNSIRVTKKKKTQMGFKLNFESSRYLNINDCYFFYGSTLPIHGITLHTTFF